MNTERHPTETPPPGTTDRHRPSWVSDESIRHWCSWVHRDTPRHEAADARLPAPLAPFDLSPLPSVPSCRPGDVVSAAATASAAQRRWERVPIAQRARAVLAFHDLLLERQEQVLDLIQWETGKARFHAWQEVAQVAAIARHYARRA